MFLKENISYELIMDAHMYSLHRYRQKNFSFFPLNLTLHEKVPNFVPYNSKISHIQIFSDHDNKHMWGQKIILIPFQNHYLIALSKISFLLAVDDPLTYVLPPFQRLTCPTLHYPPVSQASLTT